MRTSASLYRYVALGALAVLCALPIKGRAALTTWTLDDVRVSGTAPGTLTGWFTFDDVSRAVVDFNLRGDIVFLALGRSSFGLVPFGPSCSGFGMGCSVATVDSMSTITFNRISAPASTVRIVLDPDGPLTGSYVPLITELDSPSTRTSYFSGPPYGASNGPISGALLVPEPSSYLALLVGFGFLGLILRRRALRR